MERDKDDRMEVHLDLTHGQKIAVFSLAMLLLSTWIFSLAPAYERSILWRALWGWLPS